MRRWQKATLIAAGAVCTSVVAPRWFYFRRRPLPAGFERARLRGSVALSVARYSTDQERLIIVAHGLLKSMNSPAIVSTLARLRPHIDVAALDFAGHGASAGECNLDFAACARQITRVVNECRAWGYRRIALLGCSLGAAAAVIAATQGAPVDAVVAVSAPSAPPVGGMDAANGGERASHHAGPWRPWARLMGTRLAPTLKPGPWPIEIVADVAPVPLMVVHNGWDTLVRRQDSEALFAVARPPKRFHYAPRALHADPRPSLDEITAWLDEVMP